jgi:hypothetical protein
MHILYMYSINQNRASSVRIIFCSFFSNIFRTLDDSQYPIPLNNILNRWGPLITLILQFKSSMTCKNIFKYLIYKLSVSYFVVFQILASMLKIILPYIRSFKPFRYKKCISRGMKWTF